MLKKFLLCILLLLLPIATSFACKFEKPKRLRVKFVVSKQQVRVRWRQNPDAARYLMTVTDATGQEIYRKSSRRRKRFLDRDLFTPGSTYEVKVRAKKTSSCARSRFRTRSYSFTTQVETASVKASVNTTNTGGRTGTYYLPKNYPLRSLPVMVMFHGSTLDGNTMVKELRDFADEFGFIIIAPDSTDPAGWNVGTTPGEMTNDYIHSQNVITEVLGIEDLTWNGTDMIAVGVSAGGSSAAFIATNDNSFSHFAVMHGGIFYGGFGANTPGAWFSTGSSDTLRSPSHVKSFVNLLNQVAYPGEIIYTEYSVGHTVPEVENREMLEWWLE